MCDAQERISALQEEMAEVLGEQHDPIILQPLRQSSARKPLPRTLAPAETTCPSQLKTRVLLVLSHEVQD